MENKEEVLTEMLKKRNRRFKQIKISDEEFYKNVALIGEKPDCKNIEQLLEVSKELDYYIPIDYCSYYVKQDNLHIKPNVFKVKGKEKLIQSLLSMDRTAKLFILKYQKIDSQYNGQIIPFALLEFGDVLCFDRSDNSIVYYDHETDSIEKLADKWENFQTSLY